MTKNEKGTRGTSSSRQTSPSKKRNTPSDTSEDAPSLSDITSVETTTSPTKKQRKARKLTKSQATITAAVYSAMLSCLDLIDPLMEFTRACASTKVGSTKRKVGDAQEQRVRAVIDALRERLGNAPAPKEDKVVYNEYDEAETLDSDERLSGEETGEDEDEEEEVKLVKPKKKDKLNVILSQPGNDFVEVYEGPFKPSETVPVSVDEKQVEKGPEHKERKTKEKSMHKPKKRQTEVESLGGPVEDKPKSRRSSRVKAHENEGFNRAEDSANEADFEATDEDVSEPTEFWWRCQYTDADTNCWCTTWETLGRPAIWKGGRWI